MGRQYEPETKCFKGTTATLMGIRIRPLNPFRRSTSLG